MPLYTAFEPPRGTSRMDRAQRMAFVRDGFSWGEFLFPLIWLVWLRMWWILAVYVLSVIVFSLFMNWWTPGDGVRFVTAFGLSLLFAFEANGLRRWSLKRKHWHEAGTVAGTNRDMAEHAFFTRWLSRTPASAAS